jgi:hypothetical protein
VRKERGGKRWATGGELGRERMDGPAERNEPVREAGLRGECWAGRKDGLRENELGRKQERGWAAGERRAGPRARKREREGKRVWGGFSFKLFFSNLFSFLKSFCKLLKLPNSFQTFKLNYKHFKSFQD